MKKKEMKIVCLKCGELAPYMENKSNENWTSYDTSKPCPKCGNKMWGLDILRNK